MSHNQFQPAFANQFDDLLVEWKHSAKPSKANFECAVAALEFVLPQLRNHLPWAHAVVHSWAITHTPKHKIPMGEAPATFIAAHMAAKRHGRLGAGLVLQHAAGLRPSELTGLRASDVTLPEDTGDPSRRFAVLGLGLRAGTKAKRPQTVLITAPRKIALVRWLRQGLHDDDQLVGYTYEQYRRILAATLESVGLAHIAWTPHSPRSGFATDLIAFGVPFPRVQELGRWISDKSLRAYVGISASSAILVTFKLKELTHAMSYAVAHMLSFFEGAEECLRSSDGDPASCGHGSERVQEGPGAGLLFATVPSALEEPARICVSDDTALLVAGKAAPQRHAAPARGRGRGAGRCQREPQRGRGRP